VYRLLSEDLIESLGCISGLMSESQEGQHDEALEKLCQRLEEATDTDPHLIRKSIGLFVEKGFVKSRQDGNTLSWYWTHNNKGG
jgi:hypothetical protein